MSKLSPNDADLGAKSKYLLLVFSRLVFFCPNYHKPDDIVAETKYLYFLNLNRPQYCEFVSFVLRLETSVAR